MTIAKRFFVSGKVQGVFYRAFVREAALRDGLAGTVRNLPDGRVEAYVEGPAAKVTALERALRTGPLDARVDDVTSHDETPVGAADFRVTG